MLVECHEERFPFVVPVDDERVFVEHRRASLAVPVQRLHRTKVGFPDQLAVEVEAIQPERAKECKQVFAVGHRRVRRQAAGAVPLFVRQRLVQRLLPENFAARLTAKAHELVTMSDRRLSS